MFNVLILSKTFYASQNFYGFFAEHDIHRLQAVVNKSFQVSAY
jgi:hypothetical protein